MRRVMALLQFWRREPAVDKRMTALDKRSQLALNEADVAVQKAHKITLAEARIQRETQQYADRLNDRKTA